MFVRGSRTGNIALINHVNTSQDTDINVTSSPASTQIQNIDENLQPILKK